MGISSTHLGISSHIKVILSGGYCKTKSLGNLCNVISGETTPRDKLPTYIGVNECAYSKEFTRQVKSRPLETAKEATLVRK